MSNGFTSKYASVNKKRSVRYLRNIMDRPVEEQVEFLFHMMSLASSKIDDLEREVTSLKAQQQSEVVMYQ